MNFNRELSVLPRVDVNFVHSYDPETNTWARPLVIRQYSSTEHGLVQRRSLSMSVFEGYYPFPFWVGLTGNQKDSTHILGPQL